MFDDRSETGSYDSESEFTETGLDDTDGSSPRRHHHHHHHQQQQQLSHGLPLGRDSRDDDNTDWDSVRYVPSSLDEISSLHSLAHSAMKIIFNF